MELTILENKLKELYETEYFKRYNINKETGYFTDSKKGELKFETFPFIGENYGTTKKILIVGLDIGREEQIGKIQPFSERRENMMNGTNPHAAGTFFTAMYLLKDFERCYDYWQTLPEDKVCSSIIKDYKELLKDENVMSRIASTNFFKFVSKGRVLRTGNSNRFLLDIDFETDFFMKEVNIFRPDIILFQGMKNYFRHTQVVNRLKETNIEVYLSYHPSYAGKNNQKPKYMVKNFERIN